MRLVSAGPNDNQRQKTAPGRRCDGCFWRWVLSPAEVVLISVDEVWSPDFKLTVITEGGIERAGDCTRRQQRKRSVWGPGECRCPVDFFELHGRS